MVVLNNFDISFQYPNEAKKLFELNLSAQLNFPP